MISKITGKLTRIGVQTVYLDTGTIEFEIITPLNVQEKLQNKISKKVQLFTYHYFQGEEQKLFGFLEFSQRELFKTIIQLKGIGPALGLSILSHLDIEHLIDICEKKDIEKLLKIPRIGKNTAEEIIFEVNRKKKKFLNLLSESHKEVGSKITKEDMLDDVKHGLKFLGYSDKSIIKAIEKVEKKLTQKPQNVSEWIKEVLKEI
ncbi:MAG: Holliday junction branch migration protein RuvA [Leptonema sp. (in: bacteria)]